MSYLNALIGNPVLIGSLQNDLSNAQNIYEGGPIHHINIDSLILAKYHMGMRNNLADFRIREESRIATMLEF